LSPPVRRTHYDLRSSVQLRLDFQTNGRDVLTPASRWASQLVVWLVCLLPAGWAMAAAEVHLILSEPGPAYQAVAEAFRSACGQRREVKLWQLGELSNERMQVLTREDGLIVPIGLKATRFVAANHVGNAAVLSLLVPRSAFDRIDWPPGLRRHSVSAIFIDQPVSRSFKLIKAVFPDLSRVGIVISEDNTDLLGRLRQEAAMRQLSLRVATVEKDADVGPALRRVLAESDVLLLLPDHIAINSANVETVLLTTYRFRVPVVGFSKGLAKAGAVAVVYSSPEQIGRQGGQVALRWKPESGVLPAPQHASEFSIDFNSYVARSLGLSLPEEGDIRRRLGAQDE
jgi:putative ABC transport system substrate-binding protein